MKVIVPVDFSNVSLNASEFTAKMLQGKPDSTLVLYHVYTDDREEAIVRNNLEWLKETYRTKQNIKVEYKAELDNDFIHCLSRIARFEGADLVVMAVTDRSKIAQDSYSLQMIEQSVCPVLVIPPGFHYKEVRNIAIASDFKNVEQVIPVAAVKKVLEIFKPNLHIVNVNDQIYISINEEYLAQRTVLQEMFEEYKPEFHFITTFGFHESLRRFIVDRNIDLVLTFPRKHSFFNYLLKGTNTRKLVYETEVPVLAAHE